MRFKKAVKNPLDLTMWRASWAEEFVEFGRESGHFVNGMSNDGMSTAEVLTACRTRSQGYKDARLILVSQEMHELAYATTATLGKVDLYSLLPTKTGILWFEPSENGLRDSKGSVELLGIYWDTRSGTISLDMVWDFEETKNGNSDLTKRYGVSPIPLVLDVEKLEGLDDYLSGRESLVEGKESTKLTRTVLSLLAATFSLMNSKNIPIVDEKKIFIPGGRIKGKTVKAFKDSVSVVRIRNIEHREATTDGGKTLTCRFIVGGHYRNQPYKGGEIKRIFIDPYIKGPADAPLKINKPVYKF